MDKEKLEMEKDKLAREIGQRIRSLRAARNLNAGDIYEMTGISTGNTSSMENGKTCPSSLALIKLSELYGVTTDWILKGITQTENNEKTNEPGLSVAIPDLELAAYFVRIAELWEQGDERIRNWVIVQLGNAFEKVAEDVNKSKIEST